jgi:hypothetical protein
MGESYFWKPFAQGVATPIVLIGGTNLLLKDFKVSNPYLYWGGLAASSAIVLGILADKIKVPILNAESDNCPICKGDIYGDMSMIGEEIVPDICGDCDIYVMPQGSDFKVRCIECGYGDIYGSRTPCEECESIADKIEVVNNETFNADIDYSGAKRYVMALDGRFDGANDEGYFPVDEEDFSEMVVDEIGEHTILDAESFEADTSKYFDETEELYGRQNYLTFSNLGTMAYNSLYMAARELGATPIEAFNLCNSKWIRHNEDYIPENMTEMFMNMLYRDKGYKHYIDGDGDYQIKDYSRNSLWNGMMLSAKARIALNKQVGYDAETFNSDSHTDSFMAEMPVNAVKNEHGEGWTIDSVHRRDYKETFKNWKPSKYPYEKRITQDSVNENCNSCGKDKVHYQFYLPRTNSVNPKIRFIDSATYCQYDPNTCGGNICRDCADNNDSCENCGAEICSFCEEENNYEHSDLVCVDCREFNESLEDD